MNGGRPAANQKQACRLELKLKKKPQNQCIFALPALPKLELTSQKKMNSSDANKHVHLLFIAHIKNL